MFKGYTHLIIIMKRLIILKALIIIPILTFAIDISNIKFDHLTVDDGLSQNTVERIFQDRQGYIWIATRDGLNRYDGFKFETFRNEREDTNSLASSWVTAITEDAEGNIWVGSDGLNVFDPIRNKLIRVKVDLGNENAFQGGQVRDILLDFDNSLWLATSKGLVHYKPKEDIYVTYSSDSEIGIQLGYDVYSIFLNMCILYNM